MKRVLSVMLLLSFLLSALAVSVSAAPNDKACWGQATKVFAATGELGQHSKNQENPRLGLRNLARALAEAGIISDDSMQALGAFVANDL